ncbi:MAG: sigma-70 family RNA polymerase sigma factor [Nitrospirae bacterium]|nr:sigma-70 family RNA polymerase sigma factor [Nitrospirota bacterium]
MDSVDLHMLLEKHHQESFGWALNCCGHDPTEAENVLQTVYLKILEQNARFEERSSFKTWLFSVIRITAAYEQRRNFLRKWRLLPIEESRLQAKQDDADESIFKSQRTRFLQKALQTFPKRQREVMHLVFYHDMTLEESSEVLGISIGSTRTHYARGKKRLRRWIEASKEFL